MTIGQAILEYLHDPTPLASCLFCGRGYCRVGWLDLKRRATTRTAVLRECLCGAVMAVRER